MRAEERETLRLRLHAEIDRLCNGSGLLTSASVRDVIDAELAPSKRDAHDEHEAERANALAEARGGATGGVS
jgi:hypothetical protein